ncbi:hypothetical protein DFH28DRAFT_1144409 [Melampsora americana]|nr:hypothetical protein DFH28DRAFT_1144409 [Melampsora americana]
MSPMGSIRGSLEMGKSVPGRKSSRYMITCTEVVPAIQLLVKPLPIPVVGKVSSLSCPLCPLLGWGQLRYQNPHPLKSTNIAWKCHQPQRHLGNESYVRTLNLEKLVREIQERNQQFQLGSLPPSLAAIVSMPDRNGDTSIVTSNISYSCPGFNGEFGQNHRATINAKCTYRLCASCCKLSQSQGRSFCLVTSHQYLHAILLKRLSSNNLISMNKFILTPTPPSQSSRVQSAQANWAVTATLSQSQWAEYHSILKDVEQAAKHKKLAEEEQKRRLTIEFWTKPGESSLIRLSATNWPFFALEQAELFLFEGHNAGVTGWESMVMVWNTPSKRWIRISLSNTEKYPEVPCKLLVWLCMVNEDKCIGLKAAMTDVNTEGQYESLSMPLMWNISPAKKCTTQLQTAGPQDQQIKAYQTPPVPTHTKQCSPSPPSIKSDVIYLGSSDHFNPEDKIETKPKVLNTWPDSEVLLSQALKWHYNIFVTKNIRQSWNSFFVDNWIFIDTPLTTLNNARKIYAEEWKQARENKKKYRSGDAVVKQKRCRDVGLSVSRKKVRHNYEMSTSSDVEVVGY